MNKKNGKYLSKNDKKRSKYDKMEESSLAINNQPQPRNQSTGSAWTK